jgi:tRNA pseudouridine55 synthase
MIIKNIEELRTADFVGGVTILVDKPFSWTSFDVVNKLKYLLKKKLQLKKIKVGHAGTLDPLATGLLIIAIGKDTRAIEEYQDMTKRYSGIFQLGATTISYDAEFEPDQHYKTDHIDKDLLEKTRQSFIGLIEQVPPVFSALKIKGKRAYALARSGEAPVLKARNVRIFEFEIDSSDFPKINFEVLCEKGTYIRSLAHDFGKSLNSGAYLISLRRDAIGPYEVGDAFSMESLVEVLGKE